VPRSRGTWYNTQMKHLPSIAPRAVAAILAAGAVLVGVACERSGPAPVDPAYRADIEQWRARRLARLTAPDGWLTLVGLYWLDPGENSFGSSEDNDVVIPDSGLPRVAGTFELRDDGSVVIHASPGSGITLDGRPITDSLLHSDHGGKPDVLRLKSLSFYVIERGGMLAVRVKNADSATRAHFKELEYYPIDAAYRVEGVFEPYAEPRPVTVPSAHGPDQTMIAPGLVRFALRGASCSLEPLVEQAGSPDLFFVFRDDTSGKTTYGAGRFLDAAAPPPGSHAVTLDFNEAYNPPCAFTPYATCPIPPPQNVLRIAVEAGEKVPAEAH
jgi:uncharacterized protein (DUF1684 family)